MDTKLRVKPLLSRLEDKGEGAEVGDIETSESLNSLGGILTSRPTHKGKSSQRDDRVNIGLATAEGVVEELLDGGAEVEASSKDRDHLCSPGLEVRDDAGIVPLVSGHNVGALRRQRGSEEGSGGFIKGISLGAQHQ
jgi:hypothetical protein